MKQDFDKIRQRLGRIHKPDPRDLIYPMRAAIKPAPVFTHMWEPGPVMDQGDVAACVGFAWEAWMRCTPLPSNPPPGPIDIYHRALELDDLDGEDYNGTTVRAGAQVMEEAGHLKQYVWARDVETIRDFVLIRGPVVMGTNWYEGMSNPSFLNYLKPTGDVIGGHAYMIFGYSSSRDAFRMQNSWGSGFGWNGRAWIKSRDLARLLDEDGECAAGVEVPVV